LTRASAQGDVRIIEHLRAFGIEAGERDGGLFATGRPSRGARLDLAGEPDLAPPLAAMAAAAALAGHRCHFTGLGTLPGKESSRIEVLAEGLSAIGVDARAGADDLLIGPGNSSAEAVLLDPRGDHRMAFAFALLGLLREGVGVVDSDCVAKSWPGFWEDLAAAGALVPGC
jgi:3-phosphoshikimate 1-carboxyvinyltransferase